jgi:hypothetical protein
MDEAKKETSGGVELTDELVEQLAGEAERGYDISRLTRRRGRPPLGSAAAVLFQVRLDPALRGALAQRADEEQTTPSDIARRALQAYLREEAHHDDDRGGNVVPLSVLPTIEPTPWDTSGAAWTADRRGVFQWLELKAEPLAPVYAAAVALVENKDFPARVPFVAHAMREIRNRLPELIGSPVSAPRADYQALVARVQEEWEGADLPEFRGSVAGVGAEPSDSGPPVYDRLGPLLATISDLLRGHAAGTSRNRETARQLFEVVGGGPPPLYVLQAWLSGARWAQSYAHVRRELVTIDDEKSMVAQFERFEQALIALARRSYENMDELDEILGAANT